MWSDIILLVKARPRPVPLSRPETNGSNGSNGSEKVSGLREPKTLEAQQLPSDSQAVRAPMRQPEVSQLNREGVVGENRLNHSFHWTEGSRPQQYVCEPFGSGHDVEEPN